jgi:hypothetical protein
MAYDSDKPDDGDDKKANKKANKKDWEAVHKTAMEEYTRDYDKERSNIDEAYEDLRFRRGTLRDQWDDEALQARKGRPCHVVNKLPQFIRQVTGDMRRKKPGIKVVPVDSGADVETADVRGGMIRYVENRSKAKHVYTTGADSQVTCGIGHWQVMTEYAHSGTFNQEIRIGGIDDGVAVVWDADASGPTKEDADHCFVPTDMSLAKFKARWPEAKTDGFDTPGGETFVNWSSDEHIRVAAYWKKKPIKRTLALMQDGTIDDLTDVLKDSDKGAIASGMEYLKSTGARIEERNSYTVCRYLMSMGEILEEADWPGMHIPVIPVVGEEVRVGRDVYRHGVVRYARDLQRLENYYASAETEVIALQPKAPWLGTKKNFQARLDLWETANTENHPYMVYTPDAANGNKEPSRIQPPVASQAIIEGKQRNSEDMKAVIGIYDASLGAKSNETSGIAIQRRDAQADTGTFVYHDNFALAIERTAEIVNELFPKIYDTQRTMRIIGDDGKPNLVEINKPQVMNGVDRIQHDMTAGSYDVVMEEGPAYATKREQAQDGIMAFIQAFPPAAAVLGDIFAKIMDFPHTEEIGERLEEILPPQVKAKLQQERAEAEQASGKPPSPEMQQQAQAQQAAQQEAQQAKQMQIAQMQATVEEATAKAETAKQNARKAKADADKAESDAQTAKANFANSTMDHLRTIESHDHEMARGQIGHAQSTQHAQDKHEIDLTLKGFGEARAAEQHEQGAEKHKETIKQMKQPEPVMAE